MIIILRKVQGSPESNHHQLLKPGIRQALSRQTGVWRAVPVVLLILFSITMFASSVEFLPSQKSCSDDGQIDDISPSSKASSQCTNMQYSEVPLNSFLQL